MALMREDLAKYKVAYNKAVKDATMFSLFTPTTQFVPDQLVSQGKRNEIVDLSGVMGETKLQFTQMEQTIKSLKEEVAKLNKKLIEAETNSNVGDAQMQRKV